MKIKKCVKKLKEKIYAKRNKSNKVNGVGKKLEWWALS
jgi:hypothetical protein